MSYLVLRQNTSNKLTLGQMDDNFQNLFWIKDSPYLISNTTFTYSFSNFESNWLHSSGVSGFFTASFTNVSTQSNTISIANIYINQGSTGYHPLGLVLNGQSFTFSVSDEYYGRSFSTDIISFIFIRGNNSWTNISSQVESYRIVAKQPPQQLHQQLLYPLSRPAQPRPVVLLQPHHPLHLERLLQLQQLLHHHRPRLRPPHHQQPQLLRLQLGPIEIFMLMMDMLIVILSKKKYKL